MHGLAAGTLIAQRYRLTAPLGTGAQGSVWEAADARHTGSVCAVKFSHSGRQRTEVETLLSIEHSSLPRALDYGVHGDGTFLVLERIVGSPLTHGLDARTVIRALADVASALCALHDVGLVHGDVKPANVLITAERAYLVDLGLVGPTGTGLTAGTLAFMACETLAGERGPASDLYALGVTAVLALTGRHPLTDKSTEQRALLNALAVRSAPRDAVIAALPPFCRDAINGLLSPEPERRPDSARAWLGRLVRDARAELTPSQRDRTLQMSPEHPATLPLIGREREREEAYTALEQALTGQGVGFVLHGPPGAGRKRVCDAAIRATQIAWAAKGFLPEIVEEIPAEPTRPMILRRIDASPEEICHWAQTIARLSHFSATAVPIALAATTTAEPPADFGISCIPLLPLEPWALAALLEVFAGSGVSSATLSAWSEVGAGLPGRVVAIARAMEPSSVATATCEQIASFCARTEASDLDATLSPRACEIARVLAAAQEPLGRAELSTILRYTPAVASAAVGELVRRGFVLERDGRVHLLAPVNLSALAREERARIGTLLEGYLAEHEPTRVGVRARAELLCDNRHAARAHAECAADAGLTPLERAHWLELLCTLCEDPFRYTLRLCSELLTAGEARRALATLEGLAPEPEVLALRVDALRRAGAVEDARALAHTLRFSTDASARAVAQICLARDALDRGELQSARSSLGSLADGDDGPLALRGRALEVGALISMASGDTEQALARITRAESAVRDPAQRARLRSITGMVCQQCGEHEAGLRAYREAFALAAEYGDAHGAATYAVNLGAAALECGALGEAAHWLSRGTRTLARLGRMNELGRALGNLASLHAFVGDYEGSREHAARAEQAAQSAGDGATVAFAQMIAAEAMLNGTARGDALCTAASCAEAHGAVALYHDALARAAIAYARAGQLDRARENLRKSDAADRPVGLLAALEIALASGERTESLRSLLSAARSALARQPTVEHELAILALTVRVADRESDSEAAGVARAVLGVRIDALAGTLPEALAAIFRDAHAPPEPGQGARPALREPRNGPDARWRRLAEITHEINSEQRLHPLLERVMDAVVELTGAARGFILLQGPDGVLRVRTARNIGREDLRSAAGQLALSRSVAERVARTGESLVTIDAAADQRLDAFESVHSMQLRSILAVPLVVQGRAVGTLYVDDRFRAGAFGEEALEIAREFAESAALAIHNARTQALLRRSLRRTARLSQALQQRVDAQAVELEATRRALAVAPTTRGRYDEIVGRSPAMLRTLALIDKVAPTAMPVLVLGESGTGKELLARAVHANSTRNTRAFVAENCSAIPETLLESALFGHVRGAFTGADRARAGLFDVADGGTLFLDEIGEMPPAMQAKLLRVLQDGEIRALGGERSHRVDVRIIAATHRDLAERVRQGTFREDLYYRLAVMVVPIPALRHRREDLPQLIAHFIEKHAKRKVNVERRAMARLVGYHWPGNIRQLENEIMRACVLAEGTIREEDLSPALLAQPTVSEAPARVGLDLRRAIEDLERQMVHRALREHGGNQSRAAKALGLSRFGLQKKLKRLRSTAPTTPDDGTESQSEGTLARRS